MHHCHSPRTKISRQSVRVPRYVRTYVHGPSYLALAKVMTLISARKSRINLSLNQAAMGQGERERESEKKKK